MEIRSIEIIYIYKGTRHSHKTLFSALSDTKLTLLQVYFSLLQIKMRTSHCFNYKKQTLGNIKINQQNLITVINNAMTESKVKIERILCHDRNVSHIVYLCGTKSQYNAPYIQYVGT